MAFIRPLLNYGTKSPKVVSGQNCPCSKLRQKLSSFFHCLSNWSLKHLYGCCTSRFGIYINDTWAWTRYSWWFKARGYNRLLVDTWYLGYPDCLPPSLNSIRSNNYHYSEVSKVVNNISRVFFSIHICFVAIFDCGWQSLFLSFSLFSQPLFEPAAPLVIGFVETFWKWLTIFSSSRGFHMCQPCICTAGITTHLFSFPTLTVAIIFKSAPGNDKAKQVNSKKLECSEYGTPHSHFYQLGFLHAKKETPLHDSPYIMKFLLLPLIVFKSPSPNLLAWSRRIIVFTSGNISVPAGGE